MKRRGFTLLELMIVIAIIALLAAILFPIFAESRESARRSSCASNLSQIGIALNMYAQNYNGHFPEKDNDYAPLYSYVRNEDIFWCPSDSNKQRWKFLAEPAPGPMLGPGTAAPSPASGPAPSAPDVPSTGAPGAPPPPAPAPIPAFLNDDEDDSKVPLKTFSSYAYKGGLMNDDRADTPIASEAKAWHNDIANVLYLGGHIKGHPGKGYKPVVTPMKNPPPPPGERSRGGGSGG